MVHRPQDTYPLTNFRQPTGEHLERIAEGRVEPITQNGEAAMVEMSPETDDAMRIELERGHLWDQAIAGIGEGRGRDAHEVIHEVAAKLRLKLYLDAFESGTNRWRRPRKRKAPRHDPRIASPELALARLELGTTVGESEFRSLVLEFTAP